MIGYPYTMMVRPGGDTNRRPMFNPLAWLGRQGYGDLVHTPEEAQALLDAQLGMGPRMPTTGSQTGGMMPNPEVGGGAARDLGLRTVEALGPNGNAVNSASAVAAGGTPTGMDKLADAVGWGGPNGGSSAAAGNSMMAMLPLVMSLFGGGEGQAPPMPRPSPMMGGPVQPFGPLPSLQGSRPVKRPRGLLGV